MAKIIVQDHVHQLQILELDLMKKEPLLLALQQKLADCNEAKDQLGIRFWGDRTKEKDEEVTKLREDYQNRSQIVNNMTEDLDRRIPGTGSFTLRQYSDDEEQEEVFRSQQTLDELSAWTAGNEPPPTSSFPPLEEVFAHRHRGWGGRHHHRHHGRGRFPAEPWRPYWAPPPPPSMPAMSGFGHMPAPPPPPHHPFRGGQGFRQLFDRVSDAVNNPSHAASLVPTQEIKNMLDGFLLNLSNQLADTIQGATGFPPRSNSEEGTEERPIPGAFVSPALTPTESDATQTPSSTEVEKSVEAVEPIESESPTHEKVKPASKLGKGGFRHKHISCDGCLTGIRGMRYKCEVSCLHSHLPLLSADLKQCPDYDLCGACLPLLHTSELHPVSHTFKAMLHRGLTDRIKLPSDAPELAGGKHPAFCDVCQATIVGVRWKCLNCPDWDCCDKCAMTVDVSHPGHSFVKLKNPSDYVKAPSADANGSTEHSDVICDSESTARQYASNCKMVCLKSADACRL